MPMTVLKAAMVLFLTGMLAVTLGSALVTSNVLHAPVLLAADVVDTMTENWVMSKTHGATGAAEYGYSTDVYLSPPSSVFAHIWGTGMKGTDVAEVEIHKTFPWVQGQPLTRLKVSYMIDKMTDGDAWGGMAALCWVKVIPCDITGEHEYSYIIAGGTTNVSDWSYNYCMERPNTKYIDWNNEEIPAPGHGELEPPTGIWYTLDRNVDSDFAIDWSSVSEVKIKFHLHGGYLYRDEFKVYFDDLQISAEEFVKKKLLIVTSKSRLIQKFGEGGWNNLHTSMLKAFSPALVLYDASNNFLILDEQIENIGADKIEKILIVGGHDIVPFAILPNPVDDRDVLWTDDLYADFDHDRRTVIDVPIARIPDGNSLTLLMRQFTSEWGGEGGFSCANSRRPFAATINGLFGGDICWSLPTTYKNISVENVWKKYDYFMLHGLETRTDCWWGEEDIYPIAFVASQAKSNGVVVSGACYGAYTIGITSPANSICLSFLENGARCFVGSMTSTYSSPLSTRRLNGLLHRLFFTKITAGKGPLDAFYEAKVKFGSENFLWTTELKILHSYVFYGRP